MGVKHTNIRLIISAFAEWITAPWRRRKARKEKERQEAMKYILANMTTGIEKNPNRCGKIIW